jgi:hypothetical protein
MNAVDSRPSRAVNIPSEILDKLGIIARASHQTIRGLIIDILEQHIEDVYPNLDQTLKDLTGDNQ